VIFAVFTTNVATICVTRTSSVAEATVDFVTDCVPVNTVVRRFEDGRRTFDRSVLDGTNSLPLCLVSLNVSDFSACTLVENLTLGLGLAVTGCPVLVIFAVLGSALSRGLPESTTLPVAGMSSEAVTVAVLVTVAVRRSRPVLVIFAVFDTNVATICVTRTTGVAGHGFVGWIGREIHPSVRGCPVTKGRRVAPRAELDITSVLIATCVTTFTSLCGIIWDLTKYNVGSCGHSHVHPTTEGGTAVRVTPGAPLPHPMPAG
jgi:hypothetical protein